MLALYWLTLSWMLRLVPSEDPIARHGLLALAIASEAHVRPFAGTEEKTSAVMVAVAFRESSLRLGAVGDGGHSVCAFQIYDGPKTLLEDADACVSTGARMLAQSGRVDPAHPIAFYARGPRYRSEEAVRISNDRIRLARSLLSD